MENKLKNHLRREVVMKGQASTFSFSIFALFCYFYGFSLVTYLWVIKLAAIVIFATAITRLFLHMQILKNFIVSEKLWFYLKLLIWVNALGWAIILNTASYELQLSGSHFIVVTTMLAGFVGSSIISLSYFKELFIPFQLLLIVPQVLIIFYFSRFSALKLNAYPLILLHIMYFAYQFKAFKNYRKELIRLFRYQLSLENKNKKLKENQQTLIDQSVMLAHISRLSALGEMSATIAHEINNPIAIISASSQMIEKEIITVKPREEMVLTNVNRINRSVARVVKIIKGLRNLSNQSDHLPMEKTYLKEIVEDTGFFCKELLVSSNIQLTVNEIPEAVVNCHPVQISQVLINLIKNAAEVLADEQNQRERWILVNFELLADQIKIFVSNGGPKISEEIYLKIFKPFFTTKPMGIGTGLGLSISKKIIQDHGGEIILDFDQNETTFILSLNTVSII
jgi:signal transduction histidine kinase